MSLSPPFVRLTGDDWDFDVESELTLSVENQFPRDSKGMEADAWQRMFTRYSLSPHDGPIGFRAPSNGRLSVVTRSDQRLVVFLPLTLGSWDFASDGVLWPQPHGNALVMKWDDLDEEAVEKLISRLVYQRILQDDPIRYLQPVDGGGEGGYEADQVISKTKMDALDEADDRRSQARKLARTAVADARDMLLPLARDALLPLERVSGDGAHLDIAAGHVPTENAEIQVEEPWTWVDADAVLHYLNETDAFDPQINFRSGMGDDRHVRMWRENPSDVISRDQRVSRAEVGHTQLYEPPEDGSVSDDVLPVRERTDFHSAMDDPPEWMVDLIVEGTDPETVLERIDSSRREPLSLYPLSEEGAGVAGTSVRVGLDHAETGPGATYRNHPLPFQGIWLFSGSTTWDAYVGNGGFDGWRSTVLETRPTDVILIIGRKGRILPPDSGLSLPDSRKRQIVEIAEDLHDEREIRPHLGLFIAPFEAWIRDTGRIVSQIVDNATPNGSDNSRIGSVVLDLERPWNAPEEEWGTGVADSVPNDYQNFVNNELKPSYRSVIESRTDLIAVEQAGIVDTVSPVESRSRKPDRRRRSEAVFEVCDALMPMAFTSGEKFETTPGEHQAGRIWKWSRAYDLPLVVTLFLKNQREINDHSLAEAMRLQVDACARWAPDPVKGIAYWKRDLLDDKKKNILAKICRRARAVGIVEDS